MIKYLKMTTSRAESPGLNSIKGYDSVRNGLMLQIRLIQADWLSQFGQVIPGFVLIGKKHHGKHFMVETFLNAIDKRTFTQTLCASPSRITSPLSGCRHCR